MATGRTAPNGKVYPAVAKKNDDDLVPVRSIITKKNGNLNEITPDLLSKKFLETSIMEDSAIGLSMGTGFIESTTQSILGLKHGGHERILSTEGNLYAPKDCELREEGKWLILKVRGGELKYPRPDNWVNLGQTKFKAGELIGTAYNTSSPVIKLSSALKLLQAKGGNGVKYFEKDNVPISDAYAYHEGIIKYRESKRGDIEVLIGDDVYSYNPTSLYYFPDGTKISRFQRFCSGVVNMKRVSSDLGNDISSIYNIFRKQYYTLMDNGFLKNGYVSPGAMQEEMVELVFAGLTKVSREDKKGEISEVEFLGTQNSILGRKSFFTTLSYGWSNQIVSKAIKGNLDIEGDIMTETVLGLLLNDKLDKE